MSRSPIPLDTFVDYASTLLDLAEDAAFALSQGQDHILVLDPVTMSMSRLEAQPIVDQWQILLYNIQGMIRDGRIIETGDNNNAIS